MKMLPKELIKELYELSTKRVKQLEKRVPENLKEAESIKFAIATNRQIIDATKMGKGVFILGGK